MANVRKHRWPRSCFILMYHTGKHLNWKINENILSFDEVADGQFYIFIITLRSQMKHASSIKVFAQPLFVLTAFFTPYFIIYC